MSVIPIIIIIIIIIIIAIIIAVVVVIVTRQSNFLGHCRLSKPQAMMHHK